MSLAILGHFAHAALAVAVLVLIFMAWRDDGKDLF